jgi:hypothetical protein
MFPSLKACHCCVIVVFAVVGGKSTGRFTGTPGPGVLLLSFAGYNPRYTSVQEGPVQHQPERPGADQGRCRLLLPQPLCSAPSGIA